MPEDDIEQSASDVIAFRWIERSAEQVSIFVLEDEQKIQSLAEALLSRLIDGQIRQWSVERMKGIA